MNDGPARDAKVLEMRVTGLPFRTIAKELGFEHSREANSAFHRALRTQPARIRARIRKAELVRLATLADHERAKTDLTPDERARRLRAVDRLKEALLAD